jgi:hypothetical protein
MDKYRVTVMVTTDVESDSEADAIQDAANKVRVLVKDDPSKIVGSPERQCWITGIASDQERGYWVFKQVK